jgi:N-acyl amino acid synthase of PEP-CTERM/exosortase system
VKTNEFVGCTRLVRPPPENPHYQLPFEKACADTLDRSIIDSAKLPRQSIAEVSRLAVVASYRRRKGESGSAIAISTDDFGTQQMPRFPYLPVGLYLSTFELARLQKIETLFVLTEKRLASHFSKLGFDHKFIGGPVDHHGQRVPSMMNVMETINNMRASLRPLYHAIAEDIDRGIKGVDISGA